MQSHERISFKHLAAAEWSRLNTRKRIQDSDGWKNIGVIFRESLASYFAPIRMVFWLLGQLKRLGG